MKINIFHITNSDKPRANPSYPFFWMYILTSKPDKDFIGFMIS